MTRLWKCLLLSVCLFNTHSTFAVAADWTDTVLVSRIYGPYEMPEKIRQLAENHQLAIDLSEAGGVFQNTITYSVSGEADNIGRFLFELSQLINGR